MSHVLIKALVEIDEICMASGGWGAGGRSSPPEKKLLRTKKTRENNFLNLKPFVSLWTNQVGLTKIDVMLIGCQTMINCFVFER